MATSTRQPAAGDGAVMDCAACDIPDGMRHTHDLIDGLDRKCGETWTCDICGSEHTDEW